MLETSLPNQLPTGPRSLVHPDRRAVLTERRNTLTIDNSATKPYQAKTPDPLFCPLTESKTTDNHYVIVTYWRSFEGHERSHADEVFTNKFTALAAMCSDTKELGYDMLWQGEAASR